MHSVVVTNILTCSDMTDWHFFQTEQHDLRVVDVAVEPAVERAQLRANQDEGCG